ncbi:hypothetical protein E2542_SST21342 [Spatholobus suberectus]|nr:hypothetical protein E2542_SST21342 [Spatholobus suberectus]
MSVKIVDGVEPTLTARTALNNGATLLLEYILTPLTRAIVMLRSTGRFGAPSGSSLFATFVRCDRRVCCLLVHYILHLAGREFCKARRVESAEFCEACSRSLFPLRFLNLT